MIKNSGYASGESVHKLYKSVISGTPSFDRSGSFYI